MVTFERIISVPEDAVIREFTSIPILKNLLYTITESLIQYNILISKYKGLLVAKASFEEIQEFDEYCASKMSDADNLIEIPTLRDYMMGESNPYLYNSNILSFIASIACRNNTVTIYYKFTVCGHHIWTIDASIFDFREDKSAYTIIEYFDEGSLTMGQYAGYTEHSIFSADIVNGHKGKIEMPPFDIPLIGFVRKYHGYENDPYSNSWNKLTA